MGSNMKAPQTRFWLIYFGIFIPVVFGWTMLGVSRGWPMWATLLGDATFSIVLLIGLGQRYKDMGQ